MSMQTVPDGGDSVEVPINENFETLAHVATYGKDPTTTTGLTWGYYGGPWSGLSIDPDTLTLADDDDTYIVVHRPTGVLSASTSSTNWNDTDVYARVYLVTTADGLVTDVADHRAGTYGVHGNSDAAGADTTHAIIIACGDETTPTTTGVKVTFRAPYAFLLSEVRASLTTAQSSGSTFTVDILAGGVSILSTLLTIDNTEKTSKTAVAPAVLAFSPSALDDDAEVEIEVTQVGNGTAAGLKVSLIGRKV